MLPSLILSSLLGFSLTSAFPLELEEPITEGACDCSGAWVQRSDNKDYICGDWRLGPTELPRKLPLGTFIANYDRFGGLTPNEFLKLWWNDTKVDGREAGWKYPEKNGFELDEDELPIRALVNLKPGTFVDRFGYPTGRFISPATAPFSQRALHPANLIPDKEKLFPNNYHVYNVTRSFTVQAGPIRAWFGQPGFGTQFFLGQGITVQDYLDNGHLVQLNASDLVRKGPGCGFRREPKDLDSEEL
ncbi:hypothetical protein NM208_g2596 [Fusarium decemcellulare]|uniref:Uncharacterized protein n=2 Tax=Fusarium decemcellulare TaxID=57161 RepID=A0ACC1SS63_9HYPO|nr:hypothetical protein NM208_g4464 [Fusarium decemcellulare]KAJ3545269.1 hypothetical protein NM208_g2596 [Fusarium decemcellulare]